MRGVTCWWRAQGRARRRPRCWYTRERLLLLLLLLLLLRNSSGSSKTEEIVGGCLSYHFSSCSCGVKKR